VSCDVLLADPNAPATPSDSQSASNSTPQDTEKAPVSVTPETHPQTPPDDPVEPDETEPPVEWHDEPESEHVLGEYTVTFVLEGYDIYPEAQTVTEGSFASMPTPEIDPAIGTFEGAWYTEPVYDTPYKFDFNTPITEDITLYGYVIPNPAAPVLMITPEDISNLHITQPTWHIGSVDVLKEHNTSFVRLTATGDDPCIYLLPDEAGYTLPPYMAIRYRTNSVLDGQFFIGSGRGPTGQGDNFSVYWDEGEAWNLLIIDLTAVGIHSIENDLVNFLRFDFFTSGCDEGDYFDVAYVGFFNTAEYAKDYDYETYKAPTWQEDQAVIKHVSFDQLYTGSDTASAGPENIFMPGQASSWDGTAYLPDFSVDTLTYWGWVAYSGAFGRFGYQINGGTPVYDDAFTIPTEQPVIDAAISCGADSGQRMKIMISLAGLEGENTVRTLYKSADGAEVCLNEFTVILPEKPKDITNTFSSHVSSNSVGTNLQDSDLNNYFSFGFPLGSSCLIQPDGTYYMDAINEMYADVNGKYVFKTNLLDADGCSWMFVRGYQVVESDELIEKYSVSYGPYYPLRNYYETDGTNVMGTSNGTGGAGIYARMESGILHIVVKYYDITNVTRVGNKSYSLPCNGTKLTMADDGEDIYILVDGITMAVIELEGSIEYADINEVSPRNGFAAKATVRLADGTTDIFYDTLVAATSECQIGMVVRAGSLKFDTVEVFPFSHISIPEIRIPFEVPDHYDEAVDLATGHGAPFTAMQDRFGQRFNIGENFLKNISIKNLATYADGNVNTWSLKVWRWKGDYATTVSAEPLFNFIGENHPDNMTFSLDIPAELGIMGDIYYEIDYLSGSGGFTGWRALDYVDPGVETYVNGNRVGSTYASSIIVGVPIA
jgi:hypothetical protein